MAEIISYDNVNVYYNDALIVKNVSFYFKNLLNF